MGFQHKTITFSAMLALTIPCDVLFRFAATKRGVGGLACSVMRGLAPVIKSRTIDYVDECRECAGAIHRESHGGEVEMGSHVKLRPPAPRLTKSASIIHCFSRTCQKSFDLDIASFTGLSTAWTHSTQHCNCPSLHKAPSKQKLIAPQRPPPATPTL